MAPTKPITTKIINSSKTCVDDNLLGMVAAFPLLHLHPKHRVITVRLKADTGKVALIGGGGSGHEPFAGGFVGAGMLSGAVAGGIFASPPTGNVLYAIKYLYKYNSGGVFVLIGNYAGDRLNFGKAIEKAKIAGVKVEGLIAGEDIASSSNKIGGRGMLSEVMIYKLCGALADRGADLATIQQLAEESLKYMGTLGVCLNPCSLPGQPPLFEIPHGQMEWGAGIHGEAGIAKVKVGTAREVVGRILDEIIKYLKLVSGDRVVAMINNLGGTSILEMNIISKEIKEYLGSKNISTERLYYGHLKSSLEMQGFQIFLLQLQKESGDYWLELLDEPTNAPGWPGGEASVKRDGGIGDDDSVLLTEGVKGAAGPSMTVQEQDILLKSLTAAAKEAQANEALLNRLDSGCGDGDCGNTFARFGKAVIEYLKNLPFKSLEWPANVLWDLSEIAETDMGGTSGAIYSLGLSAASQGLASYKENGVSSWLAACHSAMDAITKYGGAEPGDRTMLDALYEAHAEAAELNGTVDLKSLLQQTADAADRGAKATAGMDARAGRASYVSREYTSDEDAGARAAAIWIKAICDTIADNI